MLGVKEMIAAAEKEIVTIDLATASGLLQDDLTVFVDIRDIRELQRDGKIPGAIHAPRGMLEFWIDPASPYFKEVFGDQDKRYVFYCASAWRSALSVQTVQKMGMKHACQIQGGFSAWKAAGLPVELLPPHKDA